VQRTATKLVQGIGHSTLKVRREIGVPRGLIILLERRKNFQDYEGALCSSRFMVFNWMKVVKEDMTRNCSRDDLDLTAENVLTTEIHFLHTVSILALLTRLAGSFQFHRLTATSASASRMLTHSRYSPSVGLMESWTGMGSHSQ